MSSTESYLPPGLPQPAASPDGLDNTYWEGLAKDELWIQRCNNCGAWQWGPEWICHQCNSFDMGWEQIAGDGIIYSWERCWHPVHPSLQDGVPYIVVLVEIPAAGNIRMVGNLLGDPRQDVSIGAAVEAVFEHHDDVETPFTLV
ncbi:MAG: OB-fold domain-containing protein, partial [Pseudomonadota bacterium]